MNLSQFLTCTDGPPNQWLRERCMNIYVRRSMRYIDNQMMKCLDFATVEVDERHRGKGHLTKFLLRFEEEAKRLNRVVYIESILVPRLIPFLIRMGYKFTPNTVMASPNMYKIVCLGRCPTCKG